MTGKQKAEVLAPAGSYESMTAAFAAGADAVYIGGSRFGARAYADNPDEGLLLRAIDYAHLHGRKIYMTVNTLFKEKELSELPDFLGPYYERGLDAVIVQDLGAMSLIRQQFPRLPIHASTQMTITGAYGAKLLRDLGASRIVTARELSLEEIREIRSQVDIEIESFVHGALCYCYSGQCLMSSLIGGRSGNRGRCAQPCRLPYEARQGEKRLNREEESFLLSLKDLCTLDLLPQLFEAGICSFKIEGRMKSPRYTAGVAGIYRKYVDRYLEYGKQGYQVEKEDRKLLLDLFDRGGFTDGYYRKQNGRDMVAVKEKPSFRQANQEFLAYIDRNYVNHVIKEPVRGKAFLEPGKEARLTLTMQADGGRDLAGPVSVTVFGPKVQEASSQPITRERLDKQLQKTGNTQFYFKELETEIRGSGFLPLQAVNELRRKGFSALEEAVLSRQFRSRDRNRQESVPVLGPSRQEDGAVPLLIAALEEEEQLLPALNHPDVDILYVDADGFGAAGWKKTVSGCHAAGKKCFFMLPHIFRKKAEQYFRENRGMLYDAGFDGMVVRSLEEVQWLKEEGLFGPEVVFDASMYAWNHLADQVFARWGAGRITMPVELNFRELMEKGCEGQELLVYGALPMMVSAQCIKRTVKGCSHVRETLVLKDRTRKQMAVKNHCNFCYNTIYNASPYVLLGLEEMAGKLKPSALRLQFTTESPGEVKRCLDAFAGSFLHGRKSEFWRDFTRGHIRRGVE